MPGCNWAELETELLELILAKVLANNIVDYFNFGAVCKPWKSISLLNSYLDLPPHLPCIMIHMNSRPRFFNIADNKIYQLNVTKTDSSDGHGNGWLVEKEDFQNTWRVQLLNPITGATTCLPSIHERKKVLCLPEMCKTRISSDPNSNCKDSSCVVTTIFHNYHLNDRLAFCRPGDASWTLLKNPKDLLRYEDVIYFKNHIYAINKYQNSLFVCDVHLSLQLKRIASPLPIDVPEPCSIVEQNYLIESSGDLLLVSLLTECFKVFKLEESSQEWSRVKSLGDMSIFVSYKSSFSTCASSHPKLKRDCIYFLPFTDRYHYGIFNIGNDSVEYVKAQDPFYFHNRFWVTPSLW